MRGRLAAWLGLVAVLTALGYGSRASEGKPEADVLYEYGTAIAGLIQYGLVLAVVLAIVWALPRRDALALLPPRSWLRAAGLGLAVLVATYAVGAIVEAFLDPGGEQGLTPEAWDPSRATPFALNFVVIALIAPVIEELAFRGLGFWLLARYGRVAAILLVGLAFGLVHGLVEALPVLAFFGAALAWLRDRTASLYPPIVVHAAFNAIALVLSVAA